MSKEQIGTLVVVVLKAKNLNDKHSLYKQDVFATVSLHGTEKRTPVDVKGGQHPEWDAEVRFPVCKDEGSKERKLEVACFAKEPRSDELLGKGVVDIAETLKTGEFDGKYWVPLDINGVVRGDIYLEMTYFSASPPVGGLKPPTNTFTLQRRPSKLSPSDRLSRPPTLAPSINSIPEERLHQSEFHARPYTQGIISHLLRGQY
ncbi:C2 domain-containing protein [Cyathus striatus]|nr:C2 domain-containing protein [Cyathus striatus]